MTPLSPLVTENSIKKRFKASHSRQDTTSKIIAFTVLRSLKGKHRSDREITALLEVPNSTMQSWRALEKARKVPLELEAFLLTPAGIDFLQRIVLAAYQTIHFGCGGIRGLQEFLHLSLLDHFVASSEGALQSFSNRYEDNIVAFGRTEEDRLSERIKKKKITAALDELFRGKHPCLVAIEVVSNYILLEKFTDDRSAETWCSELKPRLEELNLELQQVVSDQGSSIRACAESLGAKHVSELFHAQHELTKATSAPLAAQEKEFEKALSKAEANLKKKIERHGVDSQDAQEAKATRNLRQHGLEVRKERGKKAREAKKELGNIHHPIDMRTGKLQTADDIKTRFNEQLKIVEDCAREAELAPSCMKRLAKARRTFDAIVESLRFFFTIYMAFVKELGCDVCQECFFNEVIFPLSYLQTNWRRLKRKEKDKLISLKRDLERRLAEAPYAEEIKQAWMRRGRECAELYQRSSSCVEGRNGMLSLYYHRFHRLNIRGLKALTVVHNFHTRRCDGTTAAERLFDDKHQDLFESLVANVRIPGSPQKQNHDPIKRQIGWEKRRTA